MLMGGRPTFRFTFRTKLMLLSDSWLQTRKAGRRGETPCQIGFALFFDYSGCLGLCGF